MPLLNYTTKIDVYTTLGQIQGQLVKHGAKKIMQDYDDNGRISAVCFAIETPTGIRGIKLPANVEAVHLKLLGLVILLNAQNAKKDSMDMMVLNSAQTAAQRWMEVMTDGCYGKAGGVA